MTRQTHRNYQIYKWVCVCVDTFVRPLATLIRLKIAACVDKDRVLSINGCLELLAGNASQIYTMHVCVSVMFVRIQFNSIALRGAEASACDKWAEQATATRISPFVAVIFGGSAQMTNAAIITETTTKTTNKASATTTASE